MSHHDGEAIVRFHSPMPKGYIFVEKGNVYVTKHCRLKTKEAGKSVYVVINAKKRPIGLRVPSHIYHEVLALNRKTAASRKAVVERLDSNLESKGREVLMYMFPKIPEGSVQPILDHTLKKNSRRVGRSKILPFDECIKLAVRAHIRHHHTNYDSLLQHHSMDWRDARERVNEKVDQVVNAWGGAARTSTHLLREKSIRSDDRKDKKSGSRVDRMRSKATSGDRRGKRRRLKKKKI